jgi:hypothetical protein
VKIIFMVYLTPFLCREITTADIFCPKDLFLIEMDNYSTIIAGGENAERADTPGYPYRCIIPYLPISIDQLRIKGTITKSIGKL